MCCINSHYYKSKFPDSEVRKKSAFRTCYHKSAIAEHKADDIYED